MNWMHIGIAAVLMGGIGLLLGALLSAADKKLAVASDARWEKINAELGGANCGACGFAGCGAYADAIVEGKAPITKCPAANVEAIAALMGVEVEAEAPKKAFVRCQGGEGNTRTRYIYDGYQSCATAASMAGGPKMCHYACIGLGDCEKVCPFHAIEIRGGVAVVDENRCVGCGLCARYCPRHVIEIKPAAAKAYVKCNNGLLGRTTRANCIKACTGCGLCARKCPEKAITVEDGHAKIDYTKCTGCLACVSVCPNWCIVREDNWR